MDLIALESSQRRRKNKRLLALAELKASQESLREGWCEGQLAKLDDELTETTARIQNYKLN